MAKKKKNNAVAGENEKSGSKLLSTIIVFVIILIWILVLAFLIKWDAGGIGTALSPILKDIPVVNKVLPKDTSSDTIALNTSPYKNMSEALARIAELESQLGQMSDTNTSDNSTITALQADVDRLKVFEENQKAFEERVKDFDNKVVFTDQAPDISEYAKYYEGIEPQNAEEIYRQVVEKQQYDAKIIKQADQFSQMQPDKAAQILEGMSGDLDLVASILDSMSTAKSALILENMSAERAAQLTIKRTSAD